MISSVSFVTINVADQPRAESFYTEVLGWTLHTDQPMGEADGPRWIEVAARCTDPHRPVSGRCAQAVLRSMRLHL
ncbi:VOC family protein [Arthrobacter sp. A5]|uniref:VOC family protein n=1 Tax=Arthrobacter sp. A5 TaxID=576926 RepID=UPI003DA9EAE2